MGRRRNTTHAKLRRWLAVVVPPASGRHTPNTISFLDLVSLETVCRFRDRGTSLQKVRKVLDALRSTEPEIEHPLAHKRFFTDGAGVWVGLHGHAEKIVCAEEIVGRHKQQRAFAEAIRTFADEIRFVDNMAAAWDISPWVGIDPKICFGAPVVRGTRIPVSTITANLAEATLKKSPTGTSSASAKSKALQSSRHRPAGIRLCLDANLSFRVAEALNPDSEGIVHVSRVPELAAATKGQSDAPDEGVARWCAENERFGN